MVRLIVMVTIVTVLTTILVPAFAGIIRGSGRDTTGRRTRGVVASFLPRIRGSRGMSFLMFSLGNGGVCVCNSRRSSHILIHFANDLRAGASSISDGRRFTGHMSIVLTRVMDGLCVCPSASMARSD